MKKFASKSGFTLVELIVVIAILGILAAVAVPTYSGYIAKANEAADYTQLDAIKTAAVFAATEKKAPAAVVVNEITVTANDGTNDATVTFKGKVDGADMASAEGITTEVDTYYAGIADFTFKSGKSTAVWDGTKWEFDPTT